MFKEREETYKKFVEQQKEAEEEGIELEEGILIGHQPERRIK